MAHAYDFSRRRFLGGLTAAAAAFSLPQAASALRRRDHRLDSALVLSGGGARGAYQAGVIRELVRQSGVRDGEALPGADVICGTSIGALNGWFVATAQYGKLFALWERIARENILALKPRYAAIARESSGVLTRVSKTLSLTRGLTQHERGILDGGRIAAFLHAHIDPAVPVLVPLTFTATNLTTRSSTLFYRLPALPSESVRRAAESALHATAGRDLVIREATDAVLIPAIQASTTIPILLDPVELDGPAGVQEYIDGGIADNTPVDVARALARRIRAVLVDPAVIVDRSVDNGIAIGIAAFEIAQRKIVDSALRSAWIETRADRTLIHRREDDEASLALYDVDIQLLRPAKDLEATIVDFDRQELVDRAMATGAADARAGFRPYQFA